MEILLKLLRHYDMVSYEVGQRGNLIEPMSIQLLTIKNIMGVCSSLTHSSSSKKLAEAYDIVPVDTVALKNIALPTLSFYVLISDIKIKKCNRDTITLKFTIDKLHEYVTPSREINHSCKAYWKINHTFELCMTEYELRNTFVVIEAYNKQKTLIGHLKINMFVLWIGPYHLDFKFELQKSPDTRLSLNFKISQGIHLTISNLATQMISKEQKFNGDQFSFAIQAIIGQQIEVGASSYMTQVQDGLNLREKTQKSPIDIVCVSKEKIYWRNQPALDQILPTFDKKIAYYEIYSSSLHLIFYKITSGPKLRYQIDSQCFISLTKLMTLDYSLRKDRVNNISYFDREVHLIEKTWLHSKQIGQVRISLSFTIQAHVKQMQTCVRTQNGILTSSPVFHNTSKDYQCEEIANLTILNDKVQKQFINLDLNISEKTNFITVKQNILRINQLLSTVLALLERSSKESILFYEYKNQLELINAQRFLIDLAFKVLSYVHQDKPDIKEICWTILTAILKRGQFELNHLGFSKECKENIQSNKINQALSIKVEVAYKYQELLYKLLAETFKLLELRGEVAEMVFAEAFCSYAYFRIPPFREHIIQAITRADDPQIPEWRGTQVSLGSQSSSSKGIDDFYDLLFDWQNNFYKPISLQIKYANNDAHLQQILLRDTWKTRLAKRRGAFITFLQNLVKEIEYVSVVSKYIKWHNLPGYNKLLHAFLVEMKSTKIKSYTERFQNCCYKMLSNEKLLNIFVVILFKKTNINQSNTIFQTFEMLDQFFNVLKKNNRPIPSTFDYKYLIQGIKLVLESELEYSISQVLLVIYNHLFLFSQEFALELSLYLLSKPFFKLFSHWSYNLRHIFHELLCCKISRFEQCQPISNNSPTKNGNNYAQSMKQAIKQRYRALMNIIDTEIMPKSLNNNEDRFYDGNLFKRMKNKLMHHKGKSIRQYNQNSKIFESLNDIPLPDIRQTKSMKLPSISKHLIVTNKMFYFEDNDMNLVSIKDSELWYIRLGKSQYNNVEQDFKITLINNPKYFPMMKVKKVIDEKEISPITVDQW